MCFPSTIEELAPDSSGILSIQYLALPSLPFVFIISIVTKCLVLSFYLDLLDELLHKISYPPPCFTQRGAAFLTFTPNLEGFKIVVLLLGF